MIASHNSGFIAGALLCPQVVTALARAQRLLSVHPVTLTGSVHRASPFIGRTKVAHRSPTRVIRAAERLAEQRKCYQLEQDHSRTRVS